MKTFLVYALVPVLALAVAAIALPIINRGFRLLGMGLRLFVRVKPSGKSGALYVQVSLPPSDPDLEATSLLSQKTAVVHTQTTVVPFRGHEEQTEAQVCQ